MTKVDGSSRNAGSEGEDGQTFASKEIFILCCWSSFLGILFLTFLGDGRALVSDNGAHNLPLTSESFRQWARGDVPFWNPWLWSGSPLLDDPQAQVFYPLQMLSFVLAGESVWMVPRIVGALHILVGSLGMSLLARSLGATLPGAMIAGVSFASAPFFIRYILAFSNMAATVSWLPWCGLSLTQVLVRQRWVPAFFLGACFAALAWLGGHPQTYVQSAIVLGLVGLIAPCRSVYRRFWAAPLLVLTGLVLSAYQVIPFIHLLVRSQRAGTVATLPFEISSFPLSDLIYLGIPYSASVAQLASPAILVHFGSVAGLLALISLLRPSRLRLGLAAIALLGFLLINTGKGSLSNLLAELPLFSMLRAAPRWLLLPGFAVSLLAGFGMGELLDRPISSIRWVLSGWIGTLLLCGWVGGVSVDDPAFALVLGGAMLGLIAVAVPVVEAKRRATLTGVLVALAVVGPAMTLREDGSSLRDSARFRSLTTELLLDSDEFGRGRTLVALGFWKVEQRRAIAEAPWDLGMALGSLRQIPMASGYSGLLDPTYSKAVKVSASASSWGLNVSQLFGKIDAVADILGVRRLVVGVGGLGGAPGASLSELTALLESRVWLRKGLELNSHGPGAVLIENPRVQARVRSVGRVQFSPDRGAAVSATRRLGGLAARTAILEGDAAASGVRKCGLRNLVSGAGSFSLEATCPHGDGFLVVSERWAEGWSAWVDGVSVPVERVYGLVLGIPLPRGVHSVEIRFVSPGFVLGAWISALTLVVLSLGCAWSVRAARRQRSSFGATNRDR